MYARAANDWYRPFSKSGNGSGQNSRWRERGAVQGKVCTALPVGVGETIEETPKPGQTFVKSDVVTTDGDRIPYEFSGAD